MGTERNFTTGEKNWVPEGLTTPLRTLAPGTTVFGFSPSSSTTVAMVSRRPRSYPPEGAPRLAAESGPPSPTEDPPGARAKISHLNTRVYVQVFFEGEGGMCEEKGKVG